MTDLSPSLDHDRCSTSELFLHLDAAGAPFRDKITTENPTAHIEHYVDCVDDSELLRLKETAERLYRSSPRGEQAVLEDLIVVLAVEGAARDIVASISEPLPDPHLFDEFSDSQLLDLQQAFDAFLTRAYGGVQHNPHGDDGTFSACDADIALASAQLAAVHRHTPVVQAPHLASQYLFGAGLARHLLAQFTTTDAEELIDTFDPYTAACVSSFFSGTSQIAADDFDIDVDRLRKAISLRADSHTG